MATVTKFKEQKLTSNGFALISNLKIRTKLVLTFSCSLVMMLFVAAVGFVGLKQIEDDYPEFT